MRDWSSDVCSSDLPSAGEFMASYQYVYQMDGVSKTYLGGKQVLKDIRLFFLPGAKIGVLGANGSGKSTLMKVMAGIDTEITGEARPADGIRIGYLPTEIGRGQGRNQVTNASLVSML